MQTASEIFNDSATVHHPRLGTELFKLYRLGLLMPDFDIDITKYILDQDGVYIQHLAFRNKKNGVNLLAWLPILAYHTADGTVYGQRAKVALKLRAGSAYHNLAYGYLDAFDVKALLKMATDALAQRPSGCLPDPLVFDSPSCSEVPGTNKVVLHSEIASAEVMRLVSIGKNFLVSNEIHAPGVECWYLIDCCGHAGATFNIVTDGEVFYTTNRVTPNTKNVRVSPLSDVRKSTVHLDRASETDKKIVNKAIEIWLNKL